jgi:DNA-binding CsgD family transcriptional regulator
VAARAGVDHPADPAQALTDFGYTRAQLADLTSALPPANIPVFRSWMAGAGEAHNLLAEIGAGAGRISAIVGAMRSYAYLDQAPVQEVDIIEGLENTLMLLGSKLKAGVVVHRDYAEYLPRIQAHGRELNRSQIWINRTKDLINRIDAARAHARSRDRIAAAHGGAVSAAEPAPAVTPAGGAFELSARELEVARLVADGLSNPAIASALFISVPTVKTHVSHILAKLGLESRVQLASWVAGHDLDPPRPARS